MQPRDGAVVFDAQVEGAALGIGQTESRQGEVTIFQRLLAVSFELHGEGLGRGQRGGEPLGIVAVISSPRSALRGHQSSSPAWLSTAARPCSKRRYLAPRAAPSCSI